MKYVQFLAENILWYYNLFYIHFDKKKIKKKSFFFRYNFYTQYNVIQIITLTSLSG